MKQDVQRNVLHSASGVLTAVNGDGSKLINVLAEAVGFTGVFPRSLPDGSGVYGGHKTWAKQAAVSLERVRREERETWVHNLDEAASRAMATADPVELRKALVEIASVAIGWITDIDRRAK